MSVVLRSGPAGLRFCHGCKNRTEHQEILWAGQGYVEPVWVIVCTVCDHESWW